MKVELARLNHILIPATKAGRDRYRNGRMSRRLRIISWFFTRLSREGQALFGVALATAIFGVDVGRTESHVLVLATAALLGASLVFTRAYRLAGVTVEASAPRRVTVGDEIGITVTLANDGEGVHRWLRIGLPLLPWDGVWCQAGPSVAKLSRGERTSATLRAKFVARGEHHLDAFRVAAMLPLGLSQGAPLYTSGVRFVVVPKIAKVVSVGFVRHHRQQIGGSAQASRAGDATALLGVRPYRPGDPVRDLHARSWARHGVPVVREYQEEQFSRVGMVIDADAKAGDKTFEAALSLAAGVIANLCKGEELVDVLVAGDHAERIALGKSQASFDHALDLLAAVQAQPGFSAERMLASVGPHLERLSLVVFVALAWDEKRAALAAEVRSHGVACKVFVLTGDESRGPDVTPVSADAILRGEAIAL